MITKDDPMARTVSFIVLVLATSVLLAFGEGNMTAGISLAVFGILIVSTIDNVIRPWIIVERASLHPLAGLLGVLGGVQTLGPVGVFIGPIVVAFLQTLLMLLHREFAVGDEKAASGGIVQKNTSGFPA